MGLGTILKANRAYKAQRNGDNAEAMRLFAECFEEGMTDARYMLAYAVLMIRDGQSIVVTIVDGLPVFNTVVTGIDNGNEVEIVSGIKKGDVVITSGQQYVREGEEVNIAN